jgi:hypothetical protein
MRKEVFNLSLNAVSHNSLKGPDRENSLFLGPRIETGASIIRISVE